MPKHIRSVSVIKDTLVRYLERFFCVLALAVILTGCAGLPPRNVAASGNSVAIGDYQQTPLAAMTDKALAGDTRSGFRLMPFGSNAYATRVELAKLAQRSLDVQYYLVKSDDSGYALMRELRDAALRGVRVRLLMDDLYTSGQDDLLLGLASYPNVQVRLFNPFPNGRGSFAARLLSSAWDIRRVNRRMHNKLYIADNAAAIFGGRNIANEYVMNAPGSNFLDMDVFAAGPVVRDLSKSFDYYWNSEVVYPIEQIANGNLTNEELRANFDSKTLNASPPAPMDLSKDPTGLPPHFPPVQSIPSDVVTMINLPWELDRNQLGNLLLANAHVLYDPVSKTAGQNEIENNIHGTVTEGIVKWFAAANEQIKMVSPYFVPTENSVKLLKKIRESGVELELVTNSLAAIDEPWAYFGYRRHLKELLEIGVHVMELSPTLSVTRHRYGILGSRTVALHMKSAIVDHSEVFVGSMNLDPRSAKLNTELGVIIDSSEMAQQLERLSDAGSYYHLRLNPENHDIQWLAYGDDEKTTVYDTPPEVSSWLLFKLNLLGPLISENDL